MTTLELIVGAASLVTAIAAIVGLYLTRKEFIQRTAQLSGGMKSLADIADNQKRQVEILAIRLDALVSEQQRRTAVAERQMLQQQQQQNWNVLVGIGKLFGWALDRGLFESAEEDG